MIDGLALAITVLSLGGALRVAVLAGTGRFRWRTAVPGLAVLEAALLLQALLDVLALARGHQPREPATHLAYLVTSLLVLPAALVQTRGDDGRWSAALLAAALVVAAVLVVRMQTTWRSG